MKLYRVFNGYTGFTNVSVMVIAPDEDSAKQLASNAYRGSDHDRPPDEAYWALDRMKAELLCDDTSQTWVGEPTDT